MTTPVRPTAPARRAILRRAVRAGALVSAPLAVLLTAPARADVPEGWSEPAAVDGLHTLLFLVGGPVLLFVLIALAVYLPSLIRGERLLPDHSGGEPQWLGGPRSSTRELTAAQHSDAQRADAGHDDSRTGGASGSW